MALETVYRMAKSNVGRQRVVHVDCWWFNRELGSSEVGLSWWSVYRVAQRESHY